MDPTLLIIIVFVLAPLIERLLKAGKQVPPELPPRQRPRPRLETPQRTQHDQQQQEARNRVVVREKDDEAATMLPDDLWEILTGEKRAPPPPPAPETEVGDFEEAESLETTSAGEWISLPPEPEPAPPPVPARPPSAWSDYQTGRGVPARDARPPIRMEEGYERPLPRHEPPRVASLEALEIDDETRHDAFHRKLEATRQAPRRITPHAWRFTGDDDVRRAIVMAEVLGRPKGLE